MSVPGNNTTTADDRRATPIVQCSCLAAFPETVWSAVKTMKGVNAELTPFVVMTYPATQNALDGRLLNFGIPLFRSVVLIFGLIPIDVHTIVLESLAPNRGFVERSSSLIQREWIHERTLEPIDGGTRITDRVVFCCRLPALNFAFRPVIQFIFRHRHRRLRERFGQLPPKNVGVESE